MVVEGIEARHLSLKNEFQSLRPRYGAKRPGPQIFNVSDRLAPLYSPQGVPVGS